MAAWLPLLFLLVTVSVKRNIAFFRGNRWRLESQGLNIAPRTIDVKVEWRIVRGWRNIVARSFPIGEKDTRDRVLHVSVYTLETIGTARLQRSANDEICIATNVD